MNPTASTKQIGAAWDAFGANVARPETTAIRARATRNEL